jgi:hypothetical protein
MNLLSPMIPYSCPRLMLNLKLLSEYIGLSLISDHRVEVNLLIQEIVLQVPLVYSKPKALVFLARPGLDRGSSQVTLK